MKTINSMILFISIFISCSSCQLIFGPDLPVSIVIKHLDSILIENNGVGDQWENIYWEVNSIKNGIENEITIISSTWEELNLKTHYEEFDEVYNDIGERSYNELIYKIIKGSGMKFGLDIYNTIYEQRSENPTYSGVNAIWCDKFEVEIVYI